MVNQIQAPAVFSAHQATKKALEMKSFMNEKIAAGQIQSKLNADRMQLKMEAQLKAQEDKNAREEKIAQKVLKDNKEKNISSITSLLGKSI